MEVGFNDSFFSFFFSLAPHGPPLSLPLSLSLSHLSQLKTNSAAAACLDVALVVAARDAEAAAAAAAALSSSCCGRLLGACRCAVCLLLLRLVPRLHGVLPTEAQYSRFQLCDFGSDNRVGFALGYGLDAFVDNPHLF